jgi:hypothetical protein
MPAKVVETTAAAVGGGQPAEPVQVADRRVPHPQCVDRELAAGLGGEKRDDGLG